MRAEKARGDRADVRSSGGEYGDGNSKRAFTIAAEIMNRGDTGDVFQITLVERGSVRGLDN
jgi:hypothetical protein